MMDKKELQRVRKEIERDILNKLEQIKENVLTKEHPDSLVHIEMMSIINDELSDVLLNWDPRVIDNNLGDSLF